jgi:hypothetical protein
MQAKTTDENVLKTSVGEHIGCDYFFPVCAKTYTAYSVSRLESERGTLRSDALREGQNRQYERRRLLRLPGFQRARQSINPVD